MSLRKIVLIAGGRGIIGNELVTQLLAKGHEVKVLSRTPSDNPNFFLWNPEKEEIDEEALKNVDVIVNLSGSPIAGKRWTKKYKEEIIRSRVDSGRFLLKLSKNIPNLSHYISASGVTCYGYENDEKTYVESDGFGSDFLSSVVKDWEHIADQFSACCKVTKVRTGVVLTEKGGALPMMAKTIKSYIGSPIGSGGQNMPWISLNDIARVYIHLIENELEGVYNAITGNITNAQLTNKIAKALDKPLWLPKVPSLAMKLMFGEMSSAVLEGVCADNTKLRESGFEFQDSSIQELLGNIYKK